MDLIGLLIFLYIAYRTATDKKRGKERTSPRRRVEQKMEQPTGMPYIQDERPQMENRKWAPEPEVMGDSIEEILGKFLGVEEYLPEERSSGQELRSEPMRQVKRVEHMDRVKQVKPVVSVRRVKEIDRKPKTAVAKREHQAANANGSVLTGVDLKKAVIWSEILQKPKALRGRKML